MMLCFGECPEIRFPFSFWMEGINIKKYGTCAPQCFGRVISLSSRGRVIVQIRTAWGVQF